MKNISSDMSLWIVGIVIFAYRLLQSCSLRLDERAQIVQLGMNVSYGESLDTVKSVLI